MVRTTVILMASVAWLIGAVSAEHTQPDFSGTWVLDKAKTHNLPPQLKSYRMTVKQTEKELAVETEVKSDFSPPEGDPGGGFPGSGPPDGPGGEPPDGGPPGDLGGGGPPPSGPGSGPPSGLIALGTVIPSATYSFDGKETEAHVAGRMRGTATLKIGWTKDGKGLQLLALQQSNSEGNAESLTTQEKWTLSNGGNVLNVQHTVQTRFGTDEVKMIFKRE